MVHIWIAKVILLLVFAERSSDSLRLRSNYSPLRKIQLEFLGLFLTRNLWPSQNLILKIPLYSTFFNDKSFTVMPRFYGFPLLT